MSKFECPTIRIESIEPLENSDYLSLTHVFGYPVVFRSGDFNVGDSAIYIPVDAVVDTEKPYFSFLGEHNRIRAKKLRGIFSQGLLIQDVVGSKLGTDVASVLGVTKYVPPEPISTDGESASAPWPDAPQYTDVEHLRRYGHLLKDGEEVVVLAKIDGANARYTVVDGQLHVGSHHRWVKESPVSAWWKVADDALKAFVSIWGEGNIIFGEVYGWVQKLRYNHTPGKASFAVFDVYSADTRQYVNWDLVKRSIRYFNETHLSTLQAVPELYRGPYNFKLMELLVEQNDPISGGVMEGVIVRPVQERHEPELGGRLILKLKSKRYLLGDYE